MSDLEDKLEKYNEELRRSEAEMNKAKGRLESIHEEITELGYSDIGEARAAREQLEIKIAKREKKLDLALKDFEKRYKEIGESLHEEEDDD